jgi:nucleotide-binding universal stress UspA family protein
MTTWVESAGASTPADGRLRIVVGAAGSDEALEALQWAAAVASALDAHLVAVDVDEHDEIDLTEQEARRRDRELGERLARDYSTHGLAPEVVVDHGDVGDVLAEHAASSDLLVLGSHHVEGRRAGWRRDLVGQLMRHVVCPIAVVPPGDWFRDRSAIIVGVDGSNENAAVLRWTTWLAARLDRKLIAVHVVDPLYRTFEPFDRRSDEDVAVRHELERSAAELVERVEADTALALADLADVRRASMVVVGARRRRTVAGTALGAVATDLLDATSRPVVIVPHQYQLPHR